METTYQCYKRNEHIKRKYQDTILLGELLKLNYEFSNNEYEGTTGTDIFNIISKREKYTEQEKREMIKNAITYLNIKFNYPIREDIMVQFENIDFDRRI